MKTTKKHIVVGILAILIVNYCQSQNKILPKVKIKLDSLYPNAIISSLSRSHNTQEIEIKCNCQEFSGKMTIKFDTNGNILNKDFYFNSLKGLPDTIVNYIKKNQSPSNKFDGGFMIKSINNKGEICYSIREAYVPGYWSSEHYILKFKSTGEFISKTETDIRID